MPLLHHISKSQEINGMNSTNLAICFAPSLLWPISGLDVIKNEVPPLIQFMIEHCPKIFGAELPVLYKQAALPQAPVEDMEFSINSPPTTKQYVPTKVDDGEYSQHSSHKRSDSIGSSMSEGSTMAEAEEHMSTLLRARRSGLTLSDSQLSQISQLEEYEHIMPRPPIRKRGKIKTSGRHIHDETGIAGGNMSSPVDQPSPKRIKKTRVPERSSSLHGPNDMPYSRTRYIWSRPTPDVAAPIRRKSMVVQETLLQPRKNDFGFEIIPPSPNSSYSSSSHGYSPKVVRHSHHQKNQHYSPGYSGHETSAAAASQKKSRKITQYSHSFTSQDMEKPRLIPSSSSFYDKLIPVEMEVPSGGFSAQLELLDAEVEDDPTHHQRSILTSTPGSFGTASTTSSISTQARPSNLSLTTGGSGGSLNLGSPDLLIQNSVDRGEFIKVAISERFKLGSNGGIDYPHSSMMTPSYTQERGVVDDDTPSREGFVSPMGSESGQDSLERTQKKLQGRKRLESSGSESAFSKSSSYRGFLSTQQKKESLTSLAEEANFDDRPECDLHLGSLTRQRRHAMGGASSDSDPSKLYTGNGYNSDTESAPSRTLSRPGKIQEVMSPVKTTIPSRYYMKPPPHSETTGKTVLSAPQGYGRHQPLQQRGMPQQKSLSTGSELTASLGSERDSYWSAASPPPSIPVITEPLVTTTRTITKSSGSKHPRSKSGGGDRVEKLTEVYKAHERDQVQANIEDVKVKLGLIPPQMLRQRSKSMSENETLKLLHSSPKQQPRTVEPKEGEEEEEEEEWASKHKEWLSSAPTEDERKKARENYSKSQFQRTEYKSRLLRGSESASEKVGSVKTKATFTGPEAKRKYSTMPDSPVSNRHVKTVKIWSYQIPEVQKIRRINLRTYH